MITRTKVLALFATIAVLAVASHASAQGCAMCGSSFAPDDPVARAFNWSVLFLIAMPYTVFGVAAGWLFLAHRRRGEHRRADVIILPVRQVSAPAAGPEEN